MNSEYSITITGTDDEAFQAAISTMNLRKKALETRCVCERRMPPQRPSFRKL